MLTNSEKRYGAVAVTLHWLIAAAIVFQLGLGLYMSDLPLNDSSKFPLYQLHKSTGLTILALSVMRLGWRAFNRPPPLSAQMPGWERLAAHASHALFYLLMIGVPLAGWAMVSASPWNIPTIWFGQFQIPHLPGFAEVPDRAATEDALKGLHKTLALAMGGLLILHVGAALKHHFWDRDSVLVRMLPFTRVD